jgi:hypothetical protein
MHLPAKEDTPGLKVLRRGRVLIDNAGMATRHLAAFAFAMFSVLAAPRITQAQVRRQPYTELRYQSSTAARLNPLGLFSFFEMGPRYRLYRSPQDAFMANFVGFGFLGGLSPAFGRVGLYAEVQPLSLLRLWASYELVGYFGSFNNLASFPSASADITERNLRERGAAGTPPYNTMGGEFRAGANAQVKLGPIALRDTLRFTHSSLNVRSGDRVFYDPVTDILVPNDGWVVTNDVDLLALVEEIRFAVGARWSYAHGFFDQGHYNPGELAGPVPDNDIHRLGLLASYTFEDNGGARFDRPTLSLLVQWHLLHRTRTGQEIDTAIPYTGIAFQFFGDLLADH